LVGGQLTKATGLGSADAAAHRPASLLGQTLADGSNKNLGLRTSDASSGPFGLVGSQSIGDLANGPDPNSGNALEPIVHIFALGLAPPLSPRPPQLRNAALGHAEPRRRDVCGMAQGQEPGQGAVSASEAGQERREIEAKCDLVWHGRAGIVPQPFLELIVPPPVGRRIEAVALDAGRSGECLDAEGPLSLRQRRQGIGCAGRAADLAAGLCVQDGVGHQAGREISHRIPALGGKANVAGESGRDRHGGSLLPFGWRMAAENEMGVPFDGGEQG
jgi:hypothetical protein